MRNLVSSYSAPYRFLLQSPSFFLLFWSRLSNFSTNSPGDACYAAEKLMVRRNLHYHLKKYENGARHCIFNLVHLIAHQTLEPFFIKTFCCRKLLSYHFVMVLLSSHNLSRPVCLCWGFWSDSSIREVYSDLVELVMAHKYWPSRSLAPPIPQGSMGILQCYCKIT